MPTAVMLSEDTKQLCRLFAEVLDYPTSALLGCATECAQHLGRYSPEMARPMKSFVSFAQSQDLGTLEEIYTRTFDITPATALYVGYHLFGEDPKRSVFLVRLQEAYQAHQFSAGSELPDHLCVILRFLGVAQEPAFVIPLLDECVLPVLEKIEKAFPKNDNGYELAVTSLRLFLRHIGHSLKKQGGSHA